MLGDGENAALNSGYSADIFASWPGERSLDANNAIMNSLEAADGVEPIGDMTADQIAMRPPSALSSRAPSALSIFSPAGAAAAAAARLSRVYDADAFSDNGENVDPIAAQSTLARSKRASSTMSAEARRRLERSTHILHDKIRMKMAQHGTREVIIFILLLIQLLYRLFSIVSSNVRRRHWARASPRPNSATIPKNLLPTTSTLCSSSANIALS